MVRGRSAQWVVFHQPGHELGGFGLVHRTGSAASCTRAVKICKIRIS